MHNYAKKAAAVIFIISLAYNVFIQLQGYTVPLTGRNHWRQTQTAIVAYYQAEYGQPFSSPLPLFGEPEELPLEFPLYQTMMVYVSDWTGVSLEVSGRLLSGLFFLATLPVCFLIFRRFGLDVAQALLAMCPLLLSPVYIFISRSVLIESNALFFGMAYYYCGISYFTRPKWSWLAACIVIGAIAALVKVTTLSIAVGVLGLTFLVFLYARYKDGLGWPKILRFSDLAAMAGMLLLPLVAGLIWSLYAESIRLENPLCDFLGIKALSNQNYGPWSYWTSPFWWKMLYHRLIETVLGSPFILAVLLFLPTLKKNNLFWLCLTLIIGFLAAPLVFKNLYYAHDYYWYANSVWLLMAFGILLSYGIYSKKSTALIAFLSVLVLMCLMVHSYFGKYITLQTNPFPIPDMARCIEKIVPKGKYVLYFDYNFNPLLPYYSKRKAIMNFSNLQITDPRMQKGIALTGKANVVAVYMEKPRPEVIDYFQLNPKAIQGKLYVRDGEYREISAGKYCDK